MKTFEEVLEKARKFHSLQVLIRFSNLNRIKDENVASHSYAVVLVTRLLYDYFKNRYKIDYKKLIDMSIIHDIHEVELSDLPTNVKENNLDLKEVVIEVEKRLVKNIWNGNGEFIDIYLEYLELRTIEANIVKLADCISVLIYCENEMTLGNKYFNDVHDSVKKRVDKILERIDV